MEQNNLDPLKISIKTWNLFRIPSGQDVLAQLSVLDMTLIN